jgi:hypothetical protein
LKSHRANLTGQRGGPICKIGHSARVSWAADAFSTALAQMQFLEDARDTIRQLKVKLDDAQ